MELEYKLAELIGKAQTDEQWRNALNAMADTGWNLSAEINERLNALAREKAMAIRGKSNEFYDLCFQIRKDYGFHNAIAKFELPNIEGCGTPTITDFTDEKLTAENVAKVASTLTLK